MSNLKQDERERLTATFDELYKKNGEMLLATMDAFMGYVVSNYTLKTEATAAQERAVAEALSKVQTYIDMIPSNEAAHFISIYITELLAAPQNRGEG